jgi:hypothetical protein
VAGSFNLARHLQKVSTNMPVKLKHGKYKLPSSKWSTLPSDYFEISSNKATNCGLLPTIGCVEIVYTKSYATHITHMASMGAKEFSLFGGGNYRTHAWVAPETQRCSDNSQIIRRFVSFFPLGDGLLGSFLSGTAQGILGAAFDSREYRKVDLFAVAPTAKKSVSIDSLVDQGHNDNMKSAWKTRQWCVVLAIIGVYLYLQPIQAIVDNVSAFLHLFAFIPILGWFLSFLGDVISGTVDRMLWAISVSVGLLVALISMVLSWLYFRPSIMCACVAASLLLTLFGIMWHCKKASRSAHLHRDGKHSGPVPVWIENGNVRYKYRLHQD